MDKLDYKKEFKDFYQPKTNPSIITVPEMLFIAVDGCGNPNTCTAYKESIEILYGLSFTIKMSKMNGTQPDGYFEYVVPLLWRDFGIPMTLASMALMLRIKISFAGNF